MSRPCVLLTQCTRAFIPTKHSKRMDGSATRFVELITRPSPLTNEAMVYEKRSSNNNITTYLPFRDEGRPRFPSSLRSRRREDVQRWRQYPPDAAAGPSRAPAWWCELNTTRMKKRTGGGAQPTRAQPISNFARAANKPTSPCLAGGSMHPC